MDKIVYRITISLRDMSNSYTNNTQYYACIHDRPMLKCYTIALHTKRLKGFHKIIVYNI